MAGMASGSDFARIAQEITHMALSSPNPGAILQQYKLNPEYRLPAFIADGMVQQAMAAKSNQQALQNYNPNQPTVLDQKQDQGMAAMPTSQDMFNPSAYDQGGIGAGLGDEEEPAQMARGGVVAFAGETGSLVEPTIETAEQAAKRLGEAAKTGLGATPEAEKAAAEAARQTRIAEALKRAAARPGAASVSAAAPEAAGLAATPEAAAGAAESAAARSAGMRVLPALGPAAAVVGAGVGGFELGDYLMKNTEQGRELGENLSASPLAQPDSAEEAAKAVTTPVTAQAIATQRSTNAVAKAAGVDPVVAATFSIVARGEHSKPFTDPSALGAAVPDMGGSKSYGSFGLNSGKDGDGPVRAFQQQYGAAFGITAKPNTPEFDAQWAKAAKDKPVEFAAAQLAEVKKKYYDPTVIGLSGVLPAQAMQDPRITAYFVDRAIQQGAGSTKRDQKAINDAYNDADGNTEDFLRNMNNHDRVNINKHFGQAIKDNKYSVRANETRLEKRISGALSMSPTQRNMRELKKIPEAAASGLAALPAAIEKLPSQVADLAEQVVPAGPSAAVIPKPTAPAAAPTPAYAQAQAAAAPKETGMSEDELQQRKNIAMALMLSGAKGMSGTSQHAMVNLGAGAEEGLKGFIGLNQQQQAAKLKAQEGELNRAEKRFANLIKLKTAQIKTRLPELTDPEEREARAIYEVLATMSPRELAAQGLTTQDVLQAKAALGGNKGAAKVDTSKWGKPSIVAP